MHLLLRVGLLVALAARVASQRLLVIEYARSARSDYGLSAALDDEAMRSLFPVVDFLDIGAELEGMDVADVSTLLSQRIEGAAAILVKSNWYYVPDEFTRSWVLSARVPIALQVAGTELPPWLTPHVDALEEARSMGAATEVDGTYGDPVGLEASRSVGYYSVVFYETPWYESFAVSHPRAVQAFGIDRTIMHARGASRPTGSP